MNPTEPNNYADQIRAHRRRRGLTQEAFARRVGVTPLTVKNWERGKRPSRNLERLQAELRTTEAESTLQTEPSATPDVTYQLSLPFEPTDIAVKIGPRTADTLHVEVRFQRKTGTDDASVQTDTLPNFSEPEG